MSHHTRSLYILYNTFTFVARHGTNICFLPPLFHSGVLSETGKTKTKPKLLKCYLSSNKENHTLVHAPSSVKNHF